MSIRTMCSATDEGAKLDEYWTKQAKHDIYLQETHKGLVLELREVNGRDDSDFYAVVWNPEKQEPERVCYASTRGWSYPNGANVDATPEVLEAYATWQQKLRDERRARLAAQEAATPRKGKRVKVVKAVTQGKNVVALGEQGAVFWIGAKRQYGYKSRALSEAQALARSYGFYDERDDMRVGVLMDDGRRVFIDATKVEVVQ